MHEHVRESLPLGIQLVVVAGLIANQDLSKFIYYIKGPLRSRPFGTLGGGLATQGRSIPRGWADWGSPQILEQLK